MPWTTPSVVNSGSPEFPGLILAVCWIHTLFGLDFADRPVRAAELEVAGLERRPNRFFLALHVLEPLNEFAFGQGRFSFQEANLLASRALACAQICPRIMIERDTSCTSMKAVHDSHTDDCRRSGEPTQAVRGASLSEILELGIRELCARGEVGYVGIRDVMEKLASLPAPQEGVVPASGGALQDRIDSLLEKIEPVTCPHRRAARVGPVSVRGASGAAGEDQCREKAQGIGEVSQTCSRGPATVGS